MQIGRVNLSLKKRIDNYKDRAKYIEEYLKKRPKEWGKFQVQFNFEINAVFQEILSFERECIATGNESKLIKLKKIFVEKVKSPFERGDYIKWVVAKPYGYAGDFKYIEDVYENHPRTSGFDRLFDNYTMMSAIATAVRNRKNDFKRMIVEYVKKNPSKKIRIMDLACGPCREVLEIKKDFTEEFDNVIFDCYDMDEYALKFSKRRLEGFSGINFISENATRIAFRKNISDLIAKKYDIIYSTGLFDYFEKRIAERIIKNLRKLLNNNGVLMISDVRDRYSNPSFHFMEWVGEWPLVYRSDDEFRNLFLQAGFLEKDLDLNYEQQGILQYISAYKK